MGNASPDMCAIKRKTKLLEEKQANIHQKSATTSNFMFLLFIERGVLSFNRLNPKSRLSLHCASTHPSVYVFAEWTSPTMWAASDWGLNRAPCLSFNHFLCNSLLFTPPNHLFQSLLLSWKFLWWKWIYKEQLSFRGLFNTSGHKV